MLKKCLLKKLLPFLAISQTRPAKHSATTRFTRHSCRLGRRGNASHGFSCHSTSQHGSSRGNGILRPPCSLQESQKRLVRPAVLSNAAALHAAYSHSRRPRATRRSSLLFDIESLLPDTCLCLKASLLRRSASIVRFRWTEIRRPWADALRAVRLNRTAR